MEEPAHSVIGPSAAARWLTCPGSVPFSASLGQGDGDEGSEFAKEGSAAHALLEQCFLDDKDAFNYLGQTILDHLVNTEMADCVQEAIDYDREWDNKWGPSTYGGVEERVRLEVYDRRLFGTVDRYAIGEERVLVLDYKHGAGDDVEVVGNVQLLIYALGVLMRHPVPDETPVDMVVVQPRSGGVKVWTQTARQLWDWAEEVLVPGLKRVHEAEWDWSDAPNRLGDLAKWTSLTASNDCKWCPALIHCPVAAEHLGAALEVDEKTDPNKQPIGHLVEVYLRARLVRRYLNKVQEILEGRVRRGDKVPGVKLVAGRGTRVWSDPKKTEEYLARRLGDKAYQERQVISPAMAEKLIGKDEVRKRAFMREGGPQLAAENDRRSSLNINTAKQAFAHLLKGNDNG